MVFFLRKSEGVIRALSLIPVSGEADQKNGAAASQHSHRESEEEIPMSPIFNAQAVYQGAVKTASKPLTLFFAAFVPAPALLPPPLLGGGSGAPQEVPIPLPPPPIGSYEAK